MIPTYDQLKILSDIGPSTENNAPISGLPEGRPPGHPRAYDGI